MKKQMKINWGTSIVIAFGMFMLFILYFVYKVQSDSKYDNELVVEEYYKHDAKYQEELEKLQNSNNLSEKPKIIKTADGLEISFPANLDIKNITGNVSFYRSSNKKLDFEVPISFSGSTLHIPNKKLLGGLWDISINWNYNKVDYITKETIYY
jgi:FixH